MKMTESFREFLRGLTAIAFGWVFSAVLALPLMAYLRMSSKHGDLGSIDLFMYMTHLYFLTITMAVGAFVGFRAINRPVTVSFFVLAPFIGLFLLADPQAKDIAYSGAALILGCVSAYLVFHIRKGSKPIRNKKMVAALVIQMGVIVILLGLYFKKSYEIEGGFGIGWKDEVRSLAGMHASEEAKDDYAKGLFRLYELDGESSESIFTGRLDGQYEIWKRAHYPSLGGASRYSDEVFVDIYNAKMKRLMEKQGTGD
jgi:hypothetical protein